MIPLIGLTVGRLPAGPRLMDGADREYSLAVRRAGGASVLIPPLLPADASSLLGRFDGIVLTGGGDVSPDMYGAESSDKSGGVDRRRDDAEAAFVTAALELGVPVLGICRGCQLVNVVLGGTLVQHVSDLTPLDHLQPTPRDRLVHSVSVEPSSRLGEILGCDSLLVNSLHHQAVDRLGPGLRAVAWSSDGLVEGLEMTDRPLIGVQWHPESLPSNRPHAALFEWLVSTAADRAVRA